MKERVFRDPNYDSASHDDLVWDERFEAVSAFVQEKFAALSTEETCKILQDWISVHYARYDNWRYINWCLKETFEEFTGMLLRDCRDPEDVADYLRAAVKPFIETKPDHKLLIAVVEAVLHPKEEDEE
jgi:hypothetical protein